METATWIRLKQSLNSTLTILNRSLRWHLLMFCLQIRCTLPDRGALPSTYLFAESQISGARQRILCRQPALGKDWLWHCRELDSRYKQNLGKASTPQTTHLRRQNIFLCREPQPRVSAKKFWIFAPNFFVQPCYSTRSQDLKFGVVSIPLAIFCVFFSFS
jgi:hypothetical protein